MLADAATVAEGKLYIHGGGWDSISNPSLPVTYPAFAFVLVMDLEVTELTGDELLIELVDDEGSRILNVTGHLETDGPERFPNRTSISMPLTLTFPHVTFARAGVYTFKVHVARKHIHSLKFSVQTQ